MAYTIQDHLRAWKRAKDAGDEAAAQEIHARILAEQQASDRREYDPTIGMGTAERATAGFSRGVRQIPRNLGNMLGLVSDEDAAAQAALDAPLMATDAGRRGSLAGEAFATIAPSMLAGGGAAMLGAGLGGRAALLANPLVRGAIEGATQSVLSAEPGEDRAGAAGLGAALGAAIPAALKVGQFAVRGVRPTAEAQLLLDKGVDLTPGQMRPTGILNTIEQSYDKVPVLGNAIRNARQNAMNDFQRVAIEQASAPGAVIAKSPDINTMFAQGFKSFEPLYDQAKGFPIQKLAILKTAGPDEPLWAAVDGAVSSKRILATNDERGMVREAVRELMTALRGRAVSSDDVLAIRSAIREAKRGAESRNVRNLFKAAEAKFTDMLESQLPADAAQALRTADAQYAKLAITREAVKKAKDSAAGWTPHQFSSAVAEATDPTQYAQGQGLLRDLAKAQSSVFRAEVPATGVRNAAYAAPAAIMAATDPLIAGSLMAGGLLGAVGTRTGRQFMGGMLPWQRALQQWQPGGLLGNPENLLGLSELAQRGLVAYGGAQ